MVEIKWSWDFGLREVPLVAGTEEIKNGQNPRGVVHFSLPVTDLERSAKFYSELLGMKIVQKTPRMVFLKCGDDYFILAKILR
jgi:catechol-2,3-dioxygenase